jgi:YHS domain
MCAVIAALLLSVGTALPDAQKDDSAKPPSLPSSAKEALQPFNLLVGSWKGTGTPEGTKEERAAGTWTETISWSWQFKDKDAWLTATFEKGKYFTKGELRYTPEKDQPRFTFTLTAADKSTSTYAGTFKEKVLTLERTDGPAGESQRLVISLLHFNRYLYRLETRPAGTTVAFTKLYQVGATKEGVPFAEVAKGPECIVSGGLGTIKVSYKGKDYWVCCTGCRDAFKDDPEKFIKEAEAKAKKE